MENMMDNQEPFLDIEELSYDIEDDPVGAKNDLMHKHALASILADGTEGREQVISEIREQLHLCDKRLREQSEAARQFGTSFDIEYHLNKLETLAIDKGMCDGQLPGTQLVRIARANGEVIQPMWALGLGGVGQQNKKFWLGDSPRNVIEQALHELTTDQQEQPA